LNRQVAGEIGLSEGTVKVHRGGVIRTCRGLVGELLRLIERMPRPGADNRRPVAAAYLTKVI
jgi:FixJ family two-component response regulator